MKSRIIVCGLDRTGFKIFCLLRRQGAFVVGVNDKSAILLQARVLNPKIRIINRLFNGNLGDRLDKTLSDRVTLSVAAEAAPVFAFAALGNKAIGQLQLFNRTWPIHGWELLNAHLGVGDVLYITMPAAGLEQLWRTAPCEFNTVRT